MSTDSWTPRDSDAGAATHLLLLEGDGRWLAIRSVATDAGGRATETFSGSSSDVETQEALALVGAIERAAHGTSPSDELGQSLEFVLRDYPVAAPLVNVWFDVAVSRLDGAQVVLLMESLGNVQRDEPSLEVGRTLRRALKSKRRALRLGALAGLHAAGDPSADEFIVAAINEESDPSLKATAEEVIDSLRRMD